jgi:hypothetical protein
MSKRNRRRKTRRATSPTRTAPRTAVRSTVEISETPTSQNDVRGEILVSAALEAADPEPCDFEMVEPHHRFDARLMGRARSYWQFGEWAKLAGLRYEQLAPQPERGKLALLVAAGFQQLGKLDDAREWVARAREWGCGKRLVAQVLIAGAYHAVGRAAITAGDSARAVRLLETTVRTAMPTAESSLWVDTRRQIAEREVAQRRNATKLHQSLGVTPAPWMVAAAERCLQSHDVHAAITEAREQHAFSAADEVHWYLLLSNSFLERKDRLTAEHFANLARGKVVPNQIGLAAAVARQLIRVGRPDDAMEVTVEHALRADSIEAMLPAEDWSKVTTAFQHLRQAAKASGQHGQALLLEYLKSRLNAYRAELGGRRPVLIEIGTTREEVSGQGSTRQLAAFSMANDLEFITVDMDPHNSEMALELFDSMNCTHCDAIRMKGEDYLRSYDGSIDFIFLDAYDFDHGKHSELRQSRYQQFLGSRIDEQQCHQMHLECAQSLLHKLASRGVVCIDDTWLEDGKWTAKGTLAVPYLLENGFEVLEARNRAVLMRRRMDA